MSFIDTLRVSVTDRCNLRCIYCMPPDGISACSHEDILRFEEIERVVRAAVASGVKKVRLTGGEPLIRKNITQLVGMLSNIDGLQDLAMTTNGILLPQFAEPLKRAGLKRVTISIDSLDPKIFFQIARDSKLEETLEGIEAARKAGLLPIKINVVALRGLNENEVVDFARLAIGEDLEVRFIELMPFNGKNDAPCSNRSEKGFVSVEELKRRIEEALGPLEADIKHSGGPARLFKLPGGIGRVGFISPVSAPFCANCTRMRLTADGKLRMCLFSSDEIDVRGPLRAGADDRKIREIFDEAARKKPRRETPPFDENKKWMVEIGG